MAQRRTGAGEERRAAAQNNRPEIEMVFVDETQVGQASGQIGSGDIDLHDAPSLQLPYRHPEITVEQRGVGANGLE